MEVLSSGMYWHVVVFWDVLACSSLLGCTASSTVFWDVQTGISFFCDVLACITLFWDVLACITLFWDVLACSTAFWYVLTCSAVFWDVLVYSKKGHRNDVGCLLYGKFNLIRSFNLRLGKQLRAKMLIGIQRKQTYSFRMSAYSHSI